MNAYLLLGDTNPEIFDVSRGLDIVFHKEGADKFPNKQQFICEEQFRGHWSKDQLQDF